MWRHALFTALAVLPTTARADFSYDAEPPTPPMVAQHGPYTRPYPLPVVKPPKPRQLTLGQGHDVALSTALRFILPHTVTPRYTGGVDPSQMISWDGGQPWDVVLSKAVQPLGIKIKATDTDVLLER